MPSHANAKWTAEEDRVLRHHVRKHGKGKWRVVAQSLGKSTNSCTCRWFEYLDPSIDHSDFTIEEAITIIRLHKQYPQKWLDIAKELSKTRSDNLRRTRNKVKNLWYGPIMKKALELGLVVEKASEPGLVVKKASKLELVVGTEVFERTMTEKLSTGEIPLTTRRTTAATPPPLEVAGGNEIDYDAALWDHDHLDHGNGADIISDYADDTDYTNFDAGWDHLGNGAGYTFDDIPL